MAQKKAHEVDSFLKGSVSAFTIFLVYGPDRGLVSERASLLAGKSGVDVSDPFNVTRLDSSDLQSDSLKILDEINSVGLFGGKRLVWVKAGGSDKTIVEAINAIDSDPPDDMVFLVEAGDLKKSASLRKAAESAATCMALPCYGDDGRSIHALIDEELVSAGLRIDAAARQILIEHLGGDRLASRGELKKLALYCHGRDVVGESDVIEIVGDASSLSVDTAVDCVLSGDLPGLDNALSRIIASKTQIFPVLQACLRQFQLIDLVRSAMEKGRMPASGALQKYAPRMHFRRKPAFEKALSSWSAKATGAALDHLNRSILETRRQPALEESISRQALLALAIRSSRRQPR